MSLSFSLYVKALSHSNGLNERMSNGLKNVSGGEIIASVGCPLEVQ